MASSPLTRLVERHGFPVLNPDTLTSWSARHDHAVLFFAGDLSRYPESSDVAVILPELMQHFRGRVQAALIDPDAEQALQTRYAFSAWPSLVVLKRGEYVGVISRVRVWAEYLRELQTLLLAAPAPASARRIPMVTVPVRPAEKA